MARTYLTRARNDCPLNATRMPAYIHFRRNVVGSNTITRMSTASIACCPGTSAISPVGRGGAGQAMTREQAIAYALEGLPAT